MRGRFIDSRVMNLPPDLLVPPFFLAQTSAEIVEETRYDEIERLRHGGRHDESSEFTWYVLVPMGVLLCLIVLGRRMLS